MIAPLESASRLPSLRSRVVRHVVFPLAATWALGTAVTVGIANYFAQQAFDRSLLDDAYSLALNVRGEGDELALVLSPREINHVLFDQTETVYFAVLRLDGSLVAGHPGLSSERRTSGAAYAFGDISYQGKALRSVSLYRPKSAEFQVVLAQTRLSRDRMLQRLLVYAIAPQVLLLLLLALWMRRAIQDDLAPLNRLQQAVDQRPAHDFTPFVTAASTRDIQRLAASLNSLFGRIEASVQAQREFTGNVAHELRTPLAGIRAQAAYGLSHASPDVWREQLQGVLGSEQRASHMVDQLLALALADEAKLALKLEPVALDVLVRDAVMRFLPKADAASVDLGARGVDEPLWVLGKPALLEGILNNLIDNALRYAKPSALAEAQVTVEALREGSQLRLSVIDNGPGIEPQSRDQLTQRWVRGQRDAHGAQGAGLGLAIVGQYARTMGGQLLLDAHDTGTGLRASVLLSLVGGASDHGLDRHP